MNRKISYILAFLILIGPLFSESLSDRIWEHLYNNETQKAKILIEKELLKSPENLNLLSLYEVTLNAMDKKQESLKTYKKIKSIWNKNHKKKYIREKYPINLASWVRIAVIRPDVLLLASEYYLPYPVNRDEEGYYYHKITIYNRQTKNPVDFYKLEKSRNTNENHILFRIKPDGKNEIAKDFGTTLPGLQEQVDIVLNLSNITDSSSSPAP